MPCRSEPYLPCRSWMRWLHHCWGISLRPTPAILPAPSFPPRLESTEFSRPWLFLPSYFNVWARCPDDSRQDAGATPLETFLPMPRMIAIKKLLPNWRLPPVACLPEHRRSATAKAWAGEAAQPDAKVLSGGLAGYA